MYIDIGGLLGIKNHRMFSTRKTFFYYSLSLLLSLTAFTGKQILQLISNELEIQWWGCITVEILLMKNQRS